MGLSNIPYCLALFILMFNSLARTQDIYSTPGETAIDVISQVYDECLQEGSVHCLRPRFLSFLKKSISQDKIRITRDLSIIPRDGDVPDISVKQDQNVDGSGSIRMLDRVENFVATHDLRMRLPRELFTSEVTKYVPDFLLKNIPEELRLPLAPAAPVAQERRFVRKVLMPFLLGLKFKATALLPLALALIALKTWKALTLGLLSMVLSGAMVLFKLSKPKLNYEIVHFAHHPIVEHANYEHYHTHGRSLPYRGHPQPEENLATR